MTLRYGRRVIDLERNEVRSPSDVLQLTPHESALLQFLAERSGQVVRRSVLHSAVWGHTGQGAGRPVDHCVKRLRKKLEDDPAHPVLIQTIRGIGYRLTPPDPEPTFDGPQLVQALRHLPYGAARTQQELRSHRSALVEIADGDDDPNRRVDALCLLAEDIEARRHGIIEARVPLFAANRAALDTTHRAWLDMLEVLTHYRDGRGPAALARTERLLRDLGDALPQVRVRLHQMAAAFMPFHGDLQSASEHITKGETLAAALHDRGRAGAFLLARGNVASRQGNQEQSIDDYRSALAVARQTEQDHLAAIALNNLAGEHAVLGEHEAAAEYLGRSLRLARAVQDPEAIGNALANRAIFLGMSGDWQTAENEAKRAQAVFERIGEDDAMGWMQVLRGLCAAATERVQLGESRIHEAISGAKLLGQTVLRDRAKAALAAIAFVDGRPNDAKQWLDGNGHPEADAVRAITHGQPPRQSSLQSAFLVQNLPPDTTQHRRH